MLATQDVQPSAGEQLAFVELPGGNSELAEELLKVLHQKHLLDLRAAGLAVRFADTDEFDKQGFASPIDWIRFNGHLTSVAAADLIAVGENLERLPQTVQAVTDGEIGFSHLKTMARTANFIGGGFDEIKLLPKARDNSAGKFYYICDHYRHSLDPKAYEAGPDRAGGEPQAHHHDLRRRGGLDQRRLRPRGRGCPAHRLGTAGAPLRRA